MKRNPVRIVVGGLNGTNKSVAACSIETHLRGRGHSVGIHELDVYSDTHAIIYGRKDPSERFRRAKAWFRSTIRPRIDEFERDTHALVIGDLPGKYNSNGMQHMLAKADGAVLFLRATTSDLEEWKLRAWERSLRRRGIPVVLRVYSHLDEPCDGHPEGVLCFRASGRTLRPEDPDFARIALAIRRAARSLRNGTIVPFPAAAPRERTERVAARA